MVETETNSSHLLSDTDNSYLLFCSNIFDYKFIHYAKMSAIGEGGCGQQRLFETSQKFCGPAAHAINGSRTGRFPNPWGIRVVFIAMPGTNRSATDYKRIAVEIFVSRANGGINEAVRFFCTLPVGAHCFGRVRQHLRHFHLPRKALGPGDAVAL
jgi:hypothetical protein